ncbi:MAG: hypothetical protein HQK63_13705 [Desulfamplus sp.]|nr:hypothetical protein [Desulfamplus sp.]
MIFSNIGCNFEGLLDARAVFFKNHESSIKIDQNKVIPSTVILPEKRFQEFLTGVESHESRICRGYFWPLESQFNPQNGIRRIPVSLAWQLLIAAEDRKVEWKSSDNHKVSLSDIIAEHTINLLTDKKDDSKVILSIPNNLNEFAQDAIITSLQKKGCSPTLLWRPIAAAIDWCSKLDQKEINRMEKDDPFYFIHFGSDLFEFVPLHIRKVERNGKAYAVPIRKQPSITPILLSGTLILAGAAEHIAKIKYNTNDESVIWQIFTSLSQLWSLREELLTPSADSGSIQEKRFIDTGNTGKSWHVLKDRADNTDISLNNIRTLNYPEWFIKSIKECCDIELNLENYKDAFSNIAEWVENRITELVSNTNDDEPGGAIISGHFKNFKPNGLETLQDIAVRVLKKKINLGFENNLAAATYIYSDSNPKSDHIAEGCLKYAYKKSKNLPTYRDSLPKLEIRVRNDDKTGYRWETIVSTDEIEGGETYFEKFSEKFKKHFSVSQGEEHINFFLKRMDADQCRKLPFDFPAPVPEKILVDLHITMEPAQGFASVEIIPDKPELFGKKHLFLDWQRMESADCDEDSPPPISKIGYPEPVILKSHLQVFINNETIFKDYINISPRDIKYKQVLSNLKQAIKTTQFINKKSYGILDSNGNISKLTDDDYIRIPTDSLFKEEDYLRNKELIRKTIIKLDSEIKSAIAKQVNLHPHLKTLITISSFFFIEAPANCRKYLKSILINNRTSIKSNTIYSIGRSFHLLDDVKLFFEVAIERIKQDTNKTDIWVRGINKILLHREEAYKSLNKEQALFLVSFARDKMKDELFKNNIKMIFKNSANLFLFLLRWRKNESNFLTKATKDYQLGQEVKDILINAVQYAGNKNIEKILKQIAKYIEYQGDEVIDGFDVEEVEEIK